MSILDSFLGDGGEDPDNNNKGGDAQEINTGGTPPAGMMSGPQLSRPLHEIATSHYLTYAMSVITSRALPDVRDGLKPVHRRILYGMYHDMGLTADKKFRKSAAIVGTVMGRYHPHGNASIYDAMVRLAQTWNMRLPLVDGHGNFGSIDGDSPAAERYTEARLTPVVGSLLGDLKKDTVPYRPNYDGTTEEPEVLPVSLPMLLINGQVGIAVGMATSIPTHNTGEVIDACIDLVRNPQRQVATLVRNHLPGPDFPTGGIITNDADELVRIYEEGRGSVTIRSRWEVVRGKKNARSKVIITEIPYATSRQTLVERLAALALSEEGGDAFIDDVRDESSKDTRIVIELKPGADVEAALAYLLRHSPMEAKFHINLTCLAPDQGTGRVVPKQLNLKEILEEFIAFRLEVITKRIRHDLDKLEGRIHILAGFIKVLDDVRQAVDIVMGAGTKEEARGQLQAAYGIDGVQAEHVLNTRIYRLAGYEVAQVRAELAEKQATAGELRALLASEDARKALMVGELEEMKAQFSSPRKTLMDSGAKNYAYDPNSLIEDVDVYCILTRGGWVRRQKSYTDIGALRCRDGDAVGWVLGANTREALVIFTSTGQSYTIRVADLPDTTGYGEAIQSSLAFGDGERIVGCFTEGMLKEGTMLIAVTTDGQAIRVDAGRFLELSTVRGRAFMRLNDGAGVVAVDKITGDNMYAVVISHSGRVLSFDPEEISYVKGTGKGVSAITIGSDDRVIAFGLTTGSAGGALKVETNRGACHEIRHTTYGVSHRARLGHRALKRGTFEKWVQEVITKGEG